MIMKLLISVNPINNSNPFFFNSNYLFHFPSLSRQSCKLYHIFQPTSLCPSEPPKFSAIQASHSSDTLGYGGWDELQVAGNWANFGESNLLRDFLVSIGIDDKKYVFIFLFGVFCALAISRVRVSSILIFPATVLVFAIGFSFGFVQDGSFSELTVNASKNKESDEIFRGHSDRMKNLVDFFDSFDDKVDILMNDIQRAINTKEIVLGDLENYVNVIESIKLSAQNARYVNEATIDTVGTANNALVENLKPASRKSKETGEVGFELLQIFANLFGKKTVESKSNKVKERANFRQGNTDGTGSEQTEGSISTSPIKEETIGVIDDNRNKKICQSQSSSDKSALHWDSKRRIEVGSKDPNVNSNVVVGNAKRFVNSEAYYYQSNRQFVNNNHASWKMDQDHESEGWRSDDSMLDSVDFSVRLKSSETDACFVHQQMFDSRKYRSSCSRKMSVDETYTSQFGKKRENDDLHSANDQSILEDGIGASSSSAFSDDFVFDKYLTQASNLLKQAKECIKGRHDDEPAEIMLQKTANLLTKAIAMKPMSLLAVGQLGNTYLLHGELKLKISRELRTLLSKRSLLSVDNQARNLRRAHDQINKDQIAANLASVCEECEELLVEAGRRYRLALTIDGNDIRALYNWGLALSFRAQLIADIGPEASLDADKVFLAAIDKFDAMLSKGNVYASDALFRWGVALQQRSRLRPSNSKEKVKLLKQAKRLYEDALEMDSENLQLRKALSSCVSELNNRFLY
ncbi:hypothetical protein K2173_001584 [Erythroxylum novogranatense]|uniref:Uncharacterized protein n=1 Tax=Erythroxylum novogranatense TaxID=1862640 RepID=A0AAV8T3Y7_9ROSI|nr:hypothetical protein K2173_001584 [Erythroxylum novogranatense]